MMKPFKRRLTSQELRTIGGGWHPNQPAADPSPFGKDPFLDTFLRLMDSGNQKAVDGIFRGFVGHAPTCAIHPAVK